MARVRRLVGILLLLAACSEGSPFDTAVFVGPGYEVVDCEAGGIAGCIRVFSEVDGKGVGTGSCLLYAATSAGQVAVAASGELELRPGEMVEWIVRIPSHFDQWNPVCEPTSEG